MPCGPGDSRPDGTYCGPNDRCAAQPDCPCGEQYTSSAIHELCAESETDCQLRTDTTSADCRTVCRAGGGECLEVYNDVPDGTCNIDNGEPLSCTHDFFNSVICICSRSCGGGPRCVLPQRCTEGTCS